MKGILLYHTLGAKVSSMDVPAGPNATVATVGGKDIYVTKNSKGVFVNGVNVIQADIMATNGIIHAISHVLRKERPLLKIPDNGLGMIRS